MKAAVWTKKSKIEMKELDKPEPLSPNEVVIKVTGCGVCGTDVHIFHGHAPLAQPPAVLGHEVVGEVDTLGERVTDLKVGDTVCVDPVISCGRCEFCQMGRSNLCDTPTIIGYVRNGGFEQYTSVPRTHLYPISKEAGREGGILAETLACVLNGYDRLNFRAGGDALILGAGTVGLLWTQLIQHSVRARVFQTEVVASRCKAAKELGADVAINASKQDVVASMLRHAPDGVEYIIDCTGSAAAIQQALPLLKKGGTLMPFGVCPQDETLTISPFELFNNEWSIIGAKMPPLCLGRAVRIIEAGMIDCQRIVNRTLPLRDFDKGLKWFEEAKHRSIKMMVDPWL